MGKKSKPRPSRTPKLRRLFEVFHPKQERLEAFLHRVLVGDLAQATEFDEIDRELRKAAAEIGSIPGWMALLGAFNVLFDFRMRMLDARGPELAALRKSVEVSKSLLRLRQRDERQKLRQREQARAAGSSPRTTMAATWQPVLEVGFS